MDRLPGTDFGLLLRDENKPMRTKRKRMGPAANRCTEKSVSMDSIFERKRMRAFALRVHGRKKVGTESFYR